MAVAKVKRPRIGTKVQTNRRYQFVTSSSKFVTSSFIRKEQRKSMKEMVKKCDHIKSYILGVFSNLGMPVFYS